MDLQNEFIPIVCLGVMLIGALFSMFYPKTDARRHRATAVFALGAAVLLANWLMQDQSVLLTLRENIGWVLLGVIITGIRLIRN